MVWKVGVGIENFIFILYIVLLYFLVFFFNEKEIKSGCKNINSNKLFVLYCIVGRKGIVELVVCMLLVCFVIVDKIYEFDLLFL